mmetsp:Transcript_22391/g.32013  ORF Transcript_22391/g.32013 Transcript_22391/m.32013 type:complete len:125 (-) Transcript_22391:164-538(-)
MFPQLSLLLKLLMLRFEFKRDNVSVSGEDRYNCHRSEPLHVMLSLLEESNRRRDLSRLVLRRRIDFDRCSVGVVEDDCDDDNGILSLSMFSAMFQILLRYLSALLLPFWRAACRAENVIMIMYC